MANSYQDQVTDAEQAVQKIIAAFKPLDEKLIETIKLMRKIPNALTPSGTAEQLDKLTKKIDTLEKQVKKLTQTQGKLNDAQKIRNTLTGKENANNRILAKNNNLVTLSTSKLAGAYGNLNARLQIAKKRLQDLIVTGRKAGQSQKQYNRELVRSQKAFDGLNRKANAAKRAISNFKNTSFGGLLSSVRNLVTAFGILGGAALFASMTKDIFGLTKQLDSIRFTMRAVITDQIELERTQRFLKQITKDFGAELITVTNRYVKFRAASQQAGLSAKETQKIFGTFTKVAGILGLKTDELQGIFLALEQMISKGKITTEELRRQLGERLPGAMDIMANSLKVTTAELDAMLKKGEVITKEVLPGFARQVEIAFGLDSFTKVETLQAATTRLKNAWTIIIEKFGEANSVSDRLRKVFDFLADNLEKILLLIFKVIKAFVVYKAVVIGLTTIHKVYTTSLIVLTAVNKALARSTNIATAAMKAFNLATKSSPIGIIIAILGAVAAAFILFKDSVSDAQKELKEFNDEADRLAGLEERFENALDNVAEGVQRMNAASMEEGGIRERLIERLKILGVLQSEITADVQWALDLSKLTNKEIIKQTSSYVGLKTQTNEQVEAVKNAIRTAAAGFKTVNKVMLKNHEIAEKLAEKQAKLDEKAAEKIRKSIFNLAKFRIQQAIKLNKEISSNEELTLEERLAANNEFIQNSILLAELEANFKKKTAGVNSADLTLIAEKLEQNKTNILLKGIQDRERIRLESNQKIKEDWQDIQDELEEAELGEIFKEDIGGLMKKLAKDTGIPVKKLFAEFNSLYKQDYKGFLKFLKKKTKDTKTESDKQLKIEEDKRKRIITFLEKSAEILGGLDDLGAAFFNRKIQRYDDEIQKNNDFYAEVLDNENLSQEQRSAIEAEREAKNAIIEKKKRKEQRKQAIVGKIFSLGQVAISTAIALTAALLPPPIGLGPVAGFTLFPLIIANAAIQAATIIAQPIPKFEKGKGQYDNYEGWGVWGENRREAKISKDGRIEISPKNIGDHLTYVKKDDIIHPNADKLLHQLSLSDIDMKPYLFSHPSYMNNYLMMGDLFVDRMDTQTNRMIDAINRKKMSFKLNQTISLAEDIAFIMSKNDTL